MRLNGACASTDSSRTSPARRSRESPSDWTRTRAGSGSPGVVTYGAGEFEFRGTATGFHILEVMECGRGIEVRPTDVYAHEEIQGGDEANIQLGAETEVVRVHFEDDTGAPLDGWTAQWTVHGVVLPIALWQHYAERCGYPIAADADGNLLVHGLPRDTIGANAPGSATPLGSFSNDGTQSSWTIVIPKEQ